MYIGIDGSQITDRIEQLKDSLIYNFSIDRLDLPFNDMYLGIRKNIPNNTSSDIEESIKLEITQILSNKKYFDGVVLKSIVTKGEKNFVVVTINNEDIEISLE